MQRVEKIMKMLREINKKINLDEFESVKIEIDCFGKNIKIKPMPMFSDKDKT